MQIKSILKEKKIVLIIQEFIRPIIRFFVLKFYSCHGH